MKPEEIVKAAFEQCIERALERGTWTEDHASTFMNERFNDGTAMMGIQDKDVLFNLAEGAYEFGEFEYSSIDEGIQALACKRLMERSLEDVYEFVNENDIDDADGITCEQPAQKWDHINEDGRHYIYDDWAVWKFIEWGEEGFWADFTSSNPRNGIDVMREAVEHGREGEERSLILESEEELVA
jgi:hypothetical protein